MNTEPTNVQKKTETETETKVTRDELIDDVLDETRLFIHDARALINMVVGGVIVLLLMATIAMATAYAHVMNLNK